ncbi:MAG: deoxyribonuclease IV [Pseudomonadota bacterium]
MLLLGAHFSIAGGLHKALLTAKRYGCTALQLFTKNSNTWKERIVTDDEIDQFRQARKDTGITAIASHTSYLINPASPEGQKHHMSKEALVHELERSASLDIPYVVLHPGAHMESGEEKGCIRVAGSINEIFDRVPHSGTRLLLETTAGQGTNIGYTFEQLALIIEHIKDKDRIGICFDTCHTFAAGYDIRTPEAYAKTMEKFDGIIGLDNLYVIHMNDSKKGLGSRIDRHEHIGKGEIGAAAFKEIMNDKRLETIPKILETPKGKGEKDYDKINLEVLRNMVDERLNSSLLTS